MRDLIKGEPPFLLPTANLRQALQLFQATAVEVLPVISDEKERRILGYVTEQYALRRYSEELERRRAAGDESGLFSPATT